MTEPASPLVPQTDDGTRAIAADVERRLREVFSTGPWLVATEMAVGAARMADELLAAGAPSVMAIGAARGTGPLTGSINTISLDTPVVGDTMENLRAFQAALVDLPDRVRSRIDHWDPHHRARVIGPLTATVPAIADRPMFGSRRPAWIALEDKLVIDDVFRAAGVTTAPAAVVDLADRNRLARLHADLGSEAGTVWAADNDRGFHGGASGTRVVPDLDAAAALADEWSADHRRVRIMPYLEGVPCSIHGMVIGDEVVAFRPCEMVVLRNADTGRFVYGRSSTFWDPPPGDRDDMRSAAVRLGRYLAAHHGYRGVFTVDGVLTEDGFRPTEVNPRYGAALPSRLVGDDGERVNLYLLHLALIEGHVADLDAGALERWSVARMDRDRRGMCFVRTDRTPEAPRRAIVTVDGLADREDPAESPSAEGFGSVALTEVAHIPDGEHEHVAVIEWAELGGEGNLDVTFGSGMAAGGPVAPMLAAIAAEADRRWSIGVPRLRPARPVR